MAFFDGFFGPLFFGLELPVIALSPPPPPDLRPPLRLLKRADASDFFGLDDRLGLLGAVRERVVLRGVLVLLFVFEVRRLGARLTFCFFGRELALGLGLGLSSVAVD